MIPTLYLLSRGTITLLVFVLLSSLSHYVQAQNGSITTTQSFSYTGQIVTWTVPTGVTSLTIEARGAEGGDVLGRQASAGKGAIVAAQLSVIPGQSLSVLVGQSLSGRSAGGGGSFVVASPSSTTTPTPLVIAGGGGGASANNRDSGNKHGQISLNGNGGTAAGSGGSDGSGGGGTANDGGGGGGGLLGNGGGSEDFAQAGGRSFTNGGQGGFGSSRGSFGGGGSGGRNDGGGGGGYSGGGGGGASVGVGGGGGSFTAGTRLFERSGAIDGNSGNGLVIISYNQCSPFTVNLRNDGPLTCAKESVLLTTTDSPSGASYTYSFGAQASSTSSTTATVTNSGPYSVTVTIPGGCSATASTTVQNNTTPPGVSINPTNQTVCQGQTATFTATGADSYTWNTGATTASINVVANASNVYSVRGTYTGNGCSTTASATLTVNAPPVATLTASPSTVLSCAQTSLTLTAGSGTSYAFSGPGIVSQGGNQAVVNAPGTYSVTVTNAGCSSTTSIAISQDNASPTATLTNNGPLSCSTTSVTLTASPNGQSYRFSNGATPIGTTNQATVTTAGIYSVTVLSGNGCSSVASTTVTGDQAAPSVSITPTSGTITCASPSLTLTANTTAPTLRWSNGQTTSTISVSVAGTYSVTVTSTNGCRAMDQATVSGTTDAPTAPTLAASPATTTTNQPITVTASGCTGGTINWTALGGSGQASGNTYTLTQPGNYTLSASCSLNGCTSSSSTPLSVQIRPGGFAITGVNMVNCQLIDEAKGGYQVQFTPQYAGQTNSPISFAVVNELATTTAPAPYSLRLYTDNSVITLVAAQAGNGEARFAYNWLASCQSGTSPNQPPTTTGIPSQTIVQSQGYQLQLTNYFSDPDGQALTFQASGLPNGLNLSGSVISGTPSQTGVATVNVTALDPGGLQVSTSFQLTVNPMPVTPPTGFAIVGVSTVSCQVLSAGERRLTFTPQYAGQNASPISFSVVNEKLPTTDPGPYSLNLYTDNPSITLSAQQGATVSTYRYNWLAVCNPAARIGIGEAATRLQVRALGNPVDGKTAEIEIGGAMGQPVQLNLVDMQGKPVHTHRIEQAGEVERVSLPLGASTGLLLLRVSTPTQSQQIKLLAL